jgi:hypothetical protein
VRRWVRRHDVSPETGAPIRVWVGEATCPRGHQFRFLDLGDMWYGYLLARTPRSTALVRAIEDPVFEEIARLVDELVPSLPRQDRASVIQDAFSAACDPDASGTRYTLRGVPCSVCGADAATYDVPRGAPMAEAPGDVTHAQWSAMDDTARQAVVLRAVQQRNT